MTIENIRPASIYSAPVEEERKAELPGKKKPHERKLKRKFKRKLKAAKANGKRAKRDAKRACRAQHNAERERDTVAAENAVLKECLASKDKDISDALRGSDGFIYLKERVERNG